jgi:hypothetical protein
MDMIDDLNILPTINPQPTGQNGFYQFIVRLSSQPSLASSRTISRIQQECNILLKTILHGFYEITQTVALRGSNIAYLCIYDMDAQFKHAIPIHDFLSNDAIYESAHLEPLRMRLENHLRPFKLQIRSLSECAEIANAAELAALHPGVVILSISWEIPSPQ